MKLKVCGMREEQNIKMLAELKPDFVGFIFYDKSSRNIDRSINMNLLKGIKKVGVFVNENSEVVINKVRVYQLDYVQLHGDESVEYCIGLKQYGIKIIKAFAISSGFNFQITNAYENHCEYFLFDTKGIAPGGNGSVFNWNLLKKYNGKTNYLLSGGISAEEVNIILQLKQNDKRLIGVDINSKFEIIPGLKDIESIKIFKDELGV